MPPSAASELIWKLAVLPGGAQPVRDYFEGELKRRQRLAFLLVKMRRAASLGWGAALANRTFLPVTDLDDLYEFRTEFSGVQLRVYFTVHRTAEGVCLVALAATDQKHGRGRIPEALKATLRDRLRRWREDRRLEVWPTIEDLTGAVS